jgi:hypothetical protein
MDGGQGETMNTIKRIRMDLRGEDIELISGSAESDSELRDLKDLIRREYQRRGYISADLSDFEDEYDKGSVYFGTYVNGSLLAAARLIESERLPTESLYYKFNPPEALAHCPRHKLREVSRLTVLRRSGDNPIPRHVTSTVMISSLIDYGFGQGFCGGISTIKVSFLRLFNSLNLPALHEINGSELVYPREGILANFFHDENSPAVPVYYLHDESKAIFDGLFRNIMRTGKTLLDDPLQILSYEVLV